MVPLTVVTWGTRLDLLFTRCRMNTVIFVSAWIKNGEGYPGVSVGNRNPVKFFRLGKIIMVAFVATRRCRQLMTDTLFACSDIVDPKMGLWCLKNSTLRDGVPAWPLLPCDIDILKQSLFLEQYKFIGLSVPNIRNRGKNRLISSNRWTRL